MTTLPETIPREQSTPARIAILALKIAVSATLLYLLISRADAGQVMTTIRHASPAWLGVALVLYLVMIFASVWRWQILLTAQRLSLSSHTLVGSYLVATFFNNFLPSNIGGDVVRVRDTTLAAGSKTLATTIVAVDRAIGLSGLLLVAAVGATTAQSPITHHAVPGGPLVLWAGFLAVSGLLAATIALPTLTARVLAPARRFHYEWVEERLSRMTAAFARFRQEPGALLRCLAGAVLVQIVLVAFYLAVAHSANIVIGAWHLAVLVPVSFVVQMLPVSLNGLGVREATFSYYFLAAGLPIDSALALSLLGTVTIMVFSLSGAVVYALRG
jgi:uncharacterized protein (TIRG00374 family)